MSQLLMPRGEIWKDTRRIIQSESFGRDVCYELRDDHIIVLTRHDGILAVHRRKLFPFAAELSDIGKVFGDVRT